MKKILRIHFTDFWPEFNNQDNFLINTLKPRYDIILDEENPDFLFYSSYTYDHYKYTCVKIFYSAENITPDFNTSDYAIDFDHIDFGDRYFRLPFFRLNTVNDTYKSIDPIKRKFCNFIYSNMHRSAPQRQELFYALSSYKQVDSGGTLLNNIGTKIENKFLWQQEYKFSIACENSSKDGYTTEKILDALQANTVPIYWGNPSIEKDFSKKCFINAMNFPSFNELVDYVKYIDQNDEEYLKILNAPYLPKDTLVQSNIQAYPPVTEDEDFKQFLFHILDQEPHQAKKLPLHGAAPVLQKATKRLFLCYVKYNQARDIIRYIFAFIRPLKQITMNFWKNIPAFRKKSKNKQT